MTGAWREEGTDLAGACWVTVLYTPSIVSHESLLSGHLT